MYYVIIIWGFLTPPPLPFGITFSTECNQKLPFSEYVPRKVQVKLDTLFFEFFWTVYSCNFNQILILSSSLTRDVSFYCLRSVNINVSGYMFSYLASRHANYPLFFFLMSSFAFIPIRKCMHALTIRFHLELEIQNITLDTRPHGICYSHFGNRVRNEAISITQRGFINN